MTEMAALIQGLPGPPGRGRPGHPGSPGPQGRPGTSSESKSSIHCAFLLVARYTNKFIAFEIICYYVFFLLEFIEESWTYRMESLTQEKIFGKQQQSVVTSSFKRFKYHRHHLSRP